MWLRVIGYLGLVLKFAGLTLVGLRLSWLLIEDEVPFGPLRVAIDRWARERSRFRVALFITCPFCIGLWVQSGMVAVMAQLTSLPFPVLWAVGVNMVAAPLHHVLDAKVLGK